MTGITSLQGGVIAPKAVAHINWLIIPAAGSGGSNPQGAVYYVGAKVSYTLDGKADSVDVAPESIVVRPQPELVLDYFLPRDVYADDAFTPETEAAEPFTWASASRTRAAAHPTRPRSTPPSPALWRTGRAWRSAFKFGGYVGDQPAGKSLLLDFGDIESGTSKMGRWSMVTSLQANLSSSMPASPMPIPWGGGHLADQGSAHAYLGPGCARGSGRAR
ncbi:hypothetical protein [Comamonas sp. JC664]|uniref:hypothetical protein n=1 Tax=Comamonas sp. JC664 TaxID=2801917 RepID=UPI0036235632